MSKLSLPIPNEASQLYQPINAQWMEIEILQFAETNYSHFHIEYNLLRTHPKILEQ